MNHDTDLLVGLFVFAALCVAFAFGCRLADARRRQRFGAIAAVDIILAVIAGPRQHWRRPSPFPRRKKTMFSKGDKFLIAGLAVLADKVTPGALDGNGIKFIADPPELLLIEQRDSSSAVCTFLENGTATVVGTAVNSDGNPITSSEGASVQATDQAATDIVLTVTALPREPTPADATA